MTPYWLGLMRSRAAFASLSLVTSTACFNPQGRPPLDTAASDSDGATPTTSGSATDSMPPDSSGSWSGSGSSGSDTSGSSGEPQGCMAGEPGCTHQLDLVFVVDNSNTMAAEQQRLARSFPQVVDQLRSLAAPDGTPLELDVHVMVTTTDMGYAVCEAFAPPGYQPAQGQPVGTACTERLEYFNGQQSACVELCPQAVEPAADYVAFDALGSNVDAAPADIDGDGVAESAAAQALACLGPQGLSGCGFEAPLESMLQAIDPAASWNQGVAPFLRDGATLGIVIVTDEAECSANDTSIFVEETFFNVHPDTGQLQLSSALCWNAGVSCDAPDEEGGYTSCSSNDNDHLHRVQRYTDALVEQARDTQGKEVFMVGVVGVPSVTAHDPEPPFAPTEGGAQALNLHDWQDGLYPAGDMIPEDIAQGQVAAYKQWQYGIGPGCTGQDEAGEYSGQAIPPIRVMETCRALNLDDTTAGTRCCMESICDGDYSAAINCLSGLVMLTTTPAQAVDG